jgi:hypothetical protein
VLVVWFAACVSAIGADVKTGGAAAELTVTRYHDPKGDAEYWGFLPEIDPSTHYYWTRAVARADVDGDKQADDIAVVSLQQRGDEFGTVARAYLLVGERNGDAVTNRSVTVLFDDADRPCYEDCPLIYPLIDWEVEPTHTRLDLVDLTGDGVPEVCFYPWILGNASPYYLSVHTYRDGEFVPILRRRGVTRTELPSYGDADADGRFEVVLANTIFVDGTDTASDPDWVSVFEWDGEALVDDSRSYHAADEQLILEYVRRYESNTERAALVRYERYFHEYEFYMGMIHLYKDNAEKARYFLERVVEQAEREVFQAAARDALLDMDRSEDGP